MRLEQQEEILGLLAKILAGTADSAEFDQFTEWIGKSQENSQFFEQLKNIWNSADQSVDSEKIITSEALKNVLGRLPVVSRKRSFWFYWQKVAAVILIPLAIGMLIWINKNTPKAISSNEIVYNEVFTAFGTRTSLRLADSTLVWLNSGSSLSYPTKFNDKNRKVFLKGEAYFEVKSDVSRPFVVQTSTFQVEATGTRFDVTAYDSNPIAEITLISGKVAVNESGNNSKPKLISELVPDQHMIYNTETKEAQYLYGDTYRFISWKDGILMFRDTPLESVLNKISLFFNVDIELRGDELKSYRYYATFKDESLEEILKLLEMSAPISYREVERKPLPDRSFPKKKVIIWPTN